MAKMEETQKILNAIFRRHAQNVEDFKRLPPAEQRYVAEKCPHLKAPTAADEQ